MSERPLSGDQCSPQTGPADRRGPGQAATAGEAAIQPAFRNLDSPGFGAGIESAPAGGSTRKRSDSKGVRKRRPARKKPDSAEKAQDSGAATTTKGEAPAKQRPARRRGSRGGKKRTRKAETSEEPQAVEVEAPSTVEAPAKRPRRRRKSSRKTPASRKGEDEPEAADKTEASDDSEAPRQKRSRRRGSRGGRGCKKVSSAVEIEGIPGEDDDLPELAELPVEAVLIDEEPSGKRTGARERKTKKKAAKKTAKRATRKVPDPEPIDRNILVNASGPEETRVAVVEDGRIVDLQMTVKKHATYVSDIYRGRVVNLEPAIGAAFVDFGQGRNGFLHASDVLTRYGESDWSLDKLLSTPVDPDADTDVDAVDDEEPEKAEKSDKKGGPSRRGRGKDRGKGNRRGERKRMPIEKLVKKGQMVAVQITKDAIGDKGPTLTTYVSIPGRYLVLMPSLERTGVSRKIDDEKERRRLKRILSALDIPDGMGVIVRTAGIGKTKADIKRDLDYLLLAWAEFSKRLLSGRNPAPLYQESDVAIRTMRDLFTSQTESVLVDDEEVFERMVEFTKKLMPEHVDKILLHKGAKPIFHGHGVEQDFEKLFSRRVELPSGGSIVIDQTEALVAIDVNSGRTREAGAEFEDIALKTNLEAAPEIARQIRLRDLGGIIVLDYIDMMRASSRKAVEKATRDLLRTDKARSKIGRISQFGLLEMTRQRLGPGLTKLVYDTCLRCRGSGRQRNASSRAQAILRRLGTALALKGFTRVEVAAHPEVIQYLKSELSRELERLEDDSGRKLVLVPAADQLEDSVLHYYRTDGREVRPGGRRKR